MKRVILSSVLVFVVVSCNDNIYRYYSDELKNDVKIEIFFGNESPVLLPNMIRLGGHDIYSVSEKPISSQNDYKSIKLARMKGSERLFLLIVFQESDLLEKITYKKRILIFKVNGVFADAAKATFPIKTGQLLLSYNNPIIEKSVPMNKIHFDQLNAQ